MSNNWFSQGYEKVEQRSKEIDEAMKGTIPNLIIKAEDEGVYVSFLTEKPINFYEHFLKHKKRSYTCPDNGDASIGNCPLCASGNKPSFRGAFLVIDHRLEEWTDRQGSPQRRQHTLKVAKFGIRVLKSLQKQNEKIKKGSPVAEANPLGLLGVPFEVVRSGQGTDTQYAFNPLQPNEQYFPRKYELDEGKTEVDMIVDNIKPKTKEQLLEAIGGGGGGYQAPQYGTPANFQQAPQPGYGQQPPVGYGQPQGSPQGPPPGFGQPTPQQGHFPNYGGQQTQPQVADDDDVIDFG